MRTTKLSRKKTKHSRKKTKLSRKKTKLSRKKTRQRKIKGGGGFSIDNIYTINQFIHSKHELFEVSNKTNDFIEIINRNEFKTIIDVPGDGNCGLWALFAGLAFVCIFCNPNVAPRRFEDFYAKVIEKVSSANTHNRKNYEHFFDYIFNPEMSFIQALNFLNNSKDAKDTINLFRYFLHEAYLKYLKEDTRFDNTYIDFLMEDSKLSKVDECVLNDSLIDSFYKLTGLNLYVITDFNGTYTDKRQGENDYSTYNIRKISTARNGMNASSLYLFNPNGHYYLLLQIEKDILLENL